MWKRDEAVRQPAQPAVPTNEAAAAAPAAAAQAVRPETMKSQNARDVVNIGKSVVIKGELNGSEDLTIEGHVEGKIELRDHVLTIGPNGKIKAELFAKVRRRPGRGHRQRQRQREGRHPRERVGRGRHHVAARRDRRRRALPRQRRHGAEGQGRRRPAPGRSEAAAGRGAAARGSAAAAAGAKGGLVALGSAQQRTKRGGGSGRRARRRRADVSHQGAAQVPGEPDVARVSGPDGPGAGGRLERHVFRRAPRLQDHPRRSVRRSRSLSERARRRRSPNT